MKQPPPHGLQQLSQQPVSQQPESQPHELHPEELYPQESQPSELQPPSHCEQEEQELQSSHWLQPPPHHSSRPGQRHQPQPWFISQQPTDPARIIAANPDNAMIFIEIPRICRLGKPAGREIRDGSSLGLSAGGLGRIEKIVTCGIYGPIALVGMISNARASKIPAC